VSGLPPGLEDFGVRLEQAAQRDVDARLEETARREAEERGRAERRRSRLRNIGFPLVAALVAASVSAGAVRLADGPGDPIPPEPDAGTTLQPAEDPAVVVASAVPNPSGGPPWVVRAYTTPSGRECVQVGRLSGGRFGQVQRGRFRALPSSGSATCASSGASGPHIAIARHASTNLTLVYGLAIDRTPVSIRFGTQHRRATPAGFGAFVAVFEGVDPRRRIVVQTRVGGRLDVRRFP